MAGIPQNFSAISNVLANYDFVDIASGTGIINLFAGNTVDLNLLSNTQFYSDAVSTFTTFDTVALTKRLDVDFDVLLNRPLDISGKIVVNVPLGVQATDVSTTTLYAVVYVRKWTGAVETDLATNQSSTLVITSTGTSYAMKAIDLTIPLTHFKIGEYLRLTIEVWSTKNATSGSYAYIGNDPMNRSVGWDTTGAVPSKLVFQCPVRLNL